MTLRLSFAGSYSDEIKRNFKKILIALQGGGSGVPIAAVLDWPCEDLPNWPGETWVYCDGSTYSKATYAVAAARLKNTHGGDANNFAVPDRRGRAAFGRDDMGGSAASRLTSGSSGVDGKTLGASGGQQSVTPSGSNSGGAASFNKNVMNSNQTSHNHSWLASNGNTYNSSGSQVTPPNFSPVTGGGGTAGNVIRRDQTTALYTNNATVSWSSSTVNTSFTQPTFAGNAHTNVPPAQVTNYIIRIA